MMVDTTVHGLYDGDTGIYHNSPDCVDGLMSADDGSHLFAASDGDSVTLMRPLYYTDDDGRGMTCESCGLYVFEPYERYCSDCDEDHETAEDEHEADHHENGERKPGEGVYGPEDDDGTLSCEACDQEREQQEAEGLSRLMSPGQCPLLSECESCGEMYRPNANCGPNRCAPCWN
jgi:hypothetical protein